MKKYITLFLVVILVILLYFLYLKVDKETPVDPSVFADTVSSSDKLFIVQDLRNSDVDNRRNLQQCAVDFAGSQKLVGKDLIFFAYEGDECTSIDGIKQVTECEFQIGGSPVIYVQAGDTDGTIFYKSKLIVNIGPVYESHMCSVR